MTFNQSSVQNREHKKNGLLARLEAFWFSYNPFDWDFLHSDRISSSMLERLFVRHPSFEDPMDQKHVSMLYVAPSGSGKTATRRYLHRLILKKHNALSQQEEPEEIKVSCSHVLVVVLDSFSDPSAVSEKSGASATEEDLLRALAEVFCIWLTQHEETFLKASPQVQMFGWSFLNSYVSNFKFQKFTPALQAIKPRLKKIPPAFQSGLPLNKKLIDIRDLLLLDLQIEQLYFLVDKVDGQSDTIDLSKQAKIIETLLNNESLYDINRISWAFFLPDTLADVAQNTKSVKSGRLKEKKLEWDEARLIALLRRRIFDAGNLNEFSLLCEKELETWVQERYEIKPDELNLPESDGLLLGPVSPIELKLARMALSQPEGKPRHILRLAYELLDDDHWPHLSDQSSSTQPDPAITIKDWQRMEKWDMGVKKQMAHKTQVDEKSAEQQRIKETTRPDQTLPAMKKDISNLVPSQQIDFLIITALPEERDALFDKLPGHQKLPPEPESTYVYHRASLPVKYSDSKEGRYELISVSLLEMGQVDAATVTTQAIQRWHPCYVLLIGIAGGMAQKGVGLGDILVAKQIVNYAQQKHAPGGIEIRYSGSGADPKLLSASLEYTDKGWKRQIRVKRPMPGELKIYHGVVACGNAVITDPEAPVFQKLQHEWPKLIGIEMEAAGVAAAVSQAPDKIGFLMIKAVSDLANPDKNKPEGKPWRRYACHAAAAYAIGFLASGPVLQRNSV